jgi:methylmalonyl-CoA mutase
VLADGSLARELAEAASVRDREVATRRETRVGVNRFAALEKTVAESRTAHVPGPGGLTGGGGPLAAQVAAWLAGAGPAPAGEPAPTLVEALPVRPLSAPFEVLRADSDRELALAGARPRVFLAALGAPRDHAARSDWARDLLAAGGLEAVDRGAFADAAALAVAYREAGTPVAFLCSSDERYAELGEAAARALRDEGARLLVLAGSLRDTPELERRLRDAGVDALAHDGADVIATLHRIWSALEPAPRTRAGAAAATATTAPHAAAVATEPRP